MVLRRYFFAVLIGLILLSPIFVLAEEFPTLYLYYGSGCPHCKVEEVFLEELKRNMPELEIVKLEVWHNKENRELFLKKVEELEIKEVVVPLTIVGDKYLIGFDDPENSGEIIKKMILDSTSEPQTSDTISHPLFGKINIKNISLPFLAIVLGTLDGFNPCSMWALLTLITLLIATGSRKKIWLVGGVFILTSAFSYFLFMTAWLNAFIFIDYLDFTRIAVGVVAIIAGMVFIKKFFTFKPNVCEVSSSEKQQKITKRIKKVISSAKWPLMVLGVMGIAFSVNLVELLCSLGIPVVFTKTLAMHNLATWKYYAYIGAYDLFYMLDDIIVLLVAGFSMRFFHLNTKYSQYSRLVGGILMLILGLLFIFNPGLLMFK